MLYGADMRTEERIERARAARRRNDRRRVACVVGVVGVQLTAMALLPKRAPVLSVVTLVVVAIIVGTSVWEHRTGEWERRHVLRVAAAGFAGCVAWELGELVWSASAGEGWLARPGHGIRAGACAALLAHVLLQPSAADDGDEVLS